MNLQDLRYILAVEEHRHFGRAATACHISQPTLSSQVRKLEEELGVSIFERTNKSVAPTEAGEHILEHARRALDEANQMKQVAQAWKDPLSGPLKLGVIPTLAPYLMPLILAPLRNEYPHMPIELWEDVTHVLLEMMRSRRLDAALVATEVPEGNLTALDLFVEPLLAALPPDHALAGKEIVNESLLASELLVLADGHCLAAQTLRACGRRNRPSGSFQAANLETLINLVASGYGATLVPGLAAAIIGQRGVVLRPVTGKVTRTIRLVSRPGFPRVAALRALEQVIRKQVGRFQ
jgi:LysR family transcriptional regulator, hydrogen peroxide-inducible genes activator